MVISRIVELFSPFFLKKKKELFSPFFLVTAVSLNYLLQN
jgi:hypothetical protein